MKPAKQVGVWATALALVVAACGGDGAADDTTAPDADGGGSIIISGSSTVEPITARVGQAFNAANPDIAPSVEGPGTGDGFAKFCNGETDISDASRPIKDSERETCQAAGIDFVELHIATDGITVMTSPANDAVSCLAFEDLYALIGPESEGFRTWAEANDLAAELGAPYAPYADAPLIIIGPGEESGTYDTFVEFVVSDLAEVRGAEDYTRVDYQASANDNVIIQGIESNDTSLGWVGFAFYEQNQDKVKAIELDGGDGCVTPTADSIASFEYPMSRPLFIYVKTTGLAARPDLVAFVDYYLTDEGLAAVSDAGYVQLPADELEATRAAWEGAKP